MDTGVGCHALLQGIFPTQGLNPGLTHGRWILYHLGHQGSVHTHMSIHILHNLHWQADSLPLSQLVSITVTNTSQPLKIWRKIEIPPLHYWFSSTHLPSWLHLISGCDFLPFTFIYSLAYHSHFKSKSPWGKSHIKLKLAISIFLWIISESGCRGHWSEVVNEMQAFLGAQTT